LAQVVLVVLVVQTEQSVHRVQIQYWMPQVLAHLQVVLLPQAVDMVAPVILM
jgi:hypothetical protein